MLAEIVKSELRKRADQNKVALLASFFKTGPGQYGEGDKFIGITVPQTRVAIKPFLALPAREIVKLLKSEVHEDRLAALLILVWQYSKADEEKKEKIYKLYTRNLNYVNNWDLVDCSAHKIVGPYLENKSKTALTSWARSANVWQRRVAILSTFHYIKLGDFSETLRIAKILLQDQHDLIHKAVGWMLREVGKKDLAIEEAFLLQHYKIMPRTMLRYAIEKFPEKKRKTYLNGIFINS